MGDGAGGDWQREGLLLGQGDDLGVVDEGRSNGLLQFCRGGRQDCAEQEKKDGKAAHNLNDRHL
jgi:hypothetical protein